MDKTFSEWARGGLVWLPERGMGFYPVSEQPYDEAYFRKYAGYAKTNVGVALTRARIEFVKTFWTRDLVDIGIGAGQFIEQRGRGTYGYDVNPFAVEWLRSRSLWRDPYDQPIEVATFWDSLEHIHEPAQLLDNVRRFVFVSLPIFSGPDHVIRSKHFRKDEHCWYWTAPGFICWMAENGWSCLAQNSMETDFGREDIETFAFVRESQGRA